jgi:cob(I)alamin adenosyltransferase
MLLLNRCLTAEGITMNRKFAALIFVALTLIATGCERMAKSPAVSTAMMWSTPAFAASPQRYIAERDKLEIITPESDLQKSWESAVAFCSTIQCEVVSSSITTRTGDSVPSGGISLRVVPEDLKKLFAHVEKLGKIAQHTTAREDKTTAVVDTEAKIKNLTSFRDNLRAMLAKPSATTKDLVEIQKQLTDTQSELDSETAQRKILANETEKIAVEISFRVERSRENARGLAQVWNALRESGSILADSTASLITTIVAIIPWLILILPGVWLLVKAWRTLKLRRNRTVSPPPSPTAT